VDILGNAQRKLLGQEPEAGRLRRMIAQAGGGHQGAERVLRAILEAAEASSGLDGAEAILSRPDAPPAPLPAGQGGGGNGAGIPDAPAESGDSQRQALEALAGLGYGIADANARDLVQRYGAGVVLAQIACLPARLQAYEQRGEPVANPAGLLIRAIEENWPSPAERRKRGGNSGKRKETVADDRSGATRWRVDAEGLPGV
jgi:hypothetical protein